MSQNHNFITALKQWKKLTRPKITSYASLVFHLAYDIGCRWDTGSEMKMAEDEDYLRMIDEQIYYLTTQHNIAEEFLIAGLEESTARFIEKPLVEREANIAYFEKMLAEADEIDLLLSKIEQLKDPGFEEQIKHELNSWRQIISTKGNLS